MQIFITRRVSLTRRVSRTLFRLGIGSVICAGGFRLTTSFAPLVSTLLSLVVKEWIALSVNGFRVDFNRRGNWKNKRPQSAETQEAQRVLGEEEVPGLLYESELQGKKKVTGRTIKADTRDVFAIER